MLRSLLRHMLHAAELSFYVFVGVLFATLVRAGPEAPKVLAIGDSLMAFHGAAGRNVPDYLGRSLGVEITDRSVLGAHMVYRLPITGAAGLSIPKQFRGDRWDWVVMTGGGNDLWLGCGCVACDRRMNKLIARDGTRGEIPQLMHRIRQSGAQVIYVGYLRSPGLGSPIEHCRDEGNELEARVARLAARVPGVHFVSLQDLAAHGDRSLFAFDMIHPSRKASRMIAARVAQVIRLAGS